MLEFFLSTIKMEQEQFNDIIFYSNRLNYLKKHRVAQENLKLIPDNVT